MEEICKEIEKVIKAGIGAVATGVEKAQEAVEQLAQKGEPLFDKAKSAFTDAADKVAKTFQEMGKPKMEELLHDARELTLEELKNLRAALDELIADLEQEATAPEPPIPSDPDEN